ncbi:MAG: hypothetical protein C5B59_19155 [Bacteroidetes bacterium]|nr:MAG: hypothetical protein C5B59_19155 [Bacteroidota bacterium]
MKKGANLVLALLAVLPFITAHSQTSDDTKMMMAYMTPGDVHQMMAKSAGTWTGNITMWMNPNAQPTTMTCDAKTEMILGGRYLQAKNTGNMMGMPFEGIGVTGFDNAKKVFVSTWIDNFGTGIMYMEGTWDPATKTINFTGKMVDPTTGKDVPVRETLQFIDDNTQLFEMFLTGQGKEFKTMQIKYTRK